MRRNPRARRYRASILSLFLLGATGPLLEAEESIRLPAGVHRELLPLPEDPERRFEIFWTTPKGTEKLPAVLFVHGHQYDDRPGGRYYVDEGILEWANERGFLAASVSQPGYGRSDGPPDFCGPRSHRAVHAALAALRRHPRVDPERIVLFGRSRGAVVSGIVATQDPDLAGLVLSGGVYDLAGTLAMYSEENSVHMGIRENIEIEAGLGEEPMRARSVLGAPRSITAPSLLLHGEDDPVAPVRFARQLAEKIRAAGGETEEVYFSQTAHRLSREQTDGPLERFLRRFTSG